MYKYSSLSFPGSFDHSAELIFTSLFRISALNPKSGHYAALATPRVVPVRRAIALTAVSRKVVQQNRTRQCRKVLWVVGVYGI